MTLAGRRERLAGLAAMVAAVASFAFMDAGLKVLSAHYSPLQGAALRGLSALPIVFIWAVAAGGPGQLVRVRWGLHLIRGALSVAMLTTFMFALQGFSLSKAYALFFVAPLLIVIFSIFLLGERVLRVQWLAIGIGFAGVLVAAEPDVGALGWWRTLAILGTAVCYALSNVLVRIISRTDTTQSMVFWMTCMLAIGATALALLGKVFFGWQSWQPVLEQHYLLIIGVAITGALGQWGITFAFRHASPASAASLEYSALAWGMLIDFVFWSLSPSWRTLAGAAVIIGSGIYLLRFEARRSS
jgi:drug/metabolite transporter (DMT)-like permease